MTPRKEQSVFSVVATPRRTAKDHNYARSKYVSLGMQTEPCPPMTHSPPGPSQPEASQSKESDASIGTTSSELEAMEDSPEYVSTSSTPPDDSTSDPMNHKVTLLGVRHLARRSAVGKAVGGWPGSRRLARQSAVGPAVGDRQSAVGPAVGGWPGSQRPAVGPAVGGWPGSRRLARQSATGDRRLARQSAFGRQCCGAEVTYAGGYG